MTMKTSLLATKRFGYPTVEVSVGRLTFICCFQHLGDYNASYNNNPTVPHLHWTRLAHVTWLCPSCGLLPPFPPNKNMAKGEKTCKCSTPPRWLTWPHLQEAYRWGFLHRGFPAPEALVLSKELWEWFGSDFDPLAYSRFKVTQRQPALSSLGTFTLDKIVSEPEGFSGR